MPSSEVEAWLGSHKTIEGAGHKLRPMPHPKLSRTPLSVARGQAEAYYMPADGGGQGVVKKFSPATKPDESYLRAVASLLPTGVAFTSGTSRRVIDSAEVGQTARHELIEWFTGTVLMPRVSGM